MAKPSAFTPKLAKRICDLVAEGESLKTIAAMPSMPARRTVRDWLNVHPEFERAYEIARRERTDNLVDEAIAIADSVEGSESNAAVQAARLQVDTRRWMASKLLPERFGETQRLEHVGAGGKDLYPPQQEPNRTKLALGILAELRTVFDSQRDNPEMLDAVALEPPKPGVTILQSAVEIEAPPQPAEPLRLVYLAPIDRDAERKWAPWRYPYGRRYD